jgi:hypothetical protein
MRPGVGFAPALAAALVAGLALRPLLACACPSRFTSRQYSRSGGRPHFEDRPMSIYSTRNVLKFAGTLSTKFNRFRLFAGGSVGKRNSEQGERKRVAELPGKTIKAFPVAVGCLLHNVSFL